MSSTCDGEILFQYLKTVDVMQNSTLSETGSQFIFLNGLQVVCITGGSSPKTSKWKNQISLLILGHLKNYFIKALNKFLMCFEINGLKNLKLTILRCFTRNTHL